MGRVLTLSGALLALSAALSYSPGSLLAQEQDNWQDSCDYSNAVIYDGWGWDATTRQSCAPIVCETTQQDLDGDGFGVQNDRVCVVTEATTRAPVFVNQQTGTQVNLTPVYWDANKDIANRTIQCDLYYFNEDQNRYLPGEAYFEPVWRDHLTSFTFKHQPVAPVSTERPSWHRITGNGWVVVDEEPGRPLSVAPTWTVDEGVYFGPAPLSSPYLELVTTETGAKAVRKWLRVGEDASPSLTSRWFRSFADAEGYMECLDPTGADLLPTGQPDEEPLQVQLAEIVFTVPPAGTETSPPNEVINITTGQRVELAKAYWDYNRDIANRPISCIQMVRNSSGDGYYGANSNVSNSYVFPYRFPDSPQTMPLSTLLTPDDIPGTTTHDISNGLAAQRYDIFSSEYVEILEDGVRFNWNDNGYTQCSGIAPSGSPATVSPVESTNNCDYSNADLYNGWGWDNVRGQSCPPISTVQVQTGSCDYSNAENFNGWGWNNVTRESCPPLHSTEEPASNSATANNTLNLSLNFAIPARINPPSFISVIFLVNDIARPYTKNGNLYTLDAVTPADSITYVEVRVMQRHQGRATQVASAVLEIQPGIEYFSNTLNDSDFDFSIDSDNDGTSNIDEVQANTNPFEGGCVDTDGDGWGWDGTQSCRL